MLQADLSSEDSAPQRMTLLTHRDMNLVGAEHRGDVGDELRFRVEFGVVVGQQRRDRFVRQRVRHG